MNRREFVFRSAQAAALLSPVLSIRRAEAQNVAPPRRVFFWVTPSGYPHPDDFFPTGTETAFQLGHITQDLEPLKQDLVIIDGVDIAPTGLDISANHVRAPGKVLIATDILPHPSDEGEALPGGPSIDQHIARQLNLKSIEVTATDRARYSMRALPFATGPRQFKTTFAEPWQAWQRGFSGFAAAGESAAARLERLKGRKSLLDGLTEELRRFRQELNGVEKLKLDIHEDALRRVEQSAAADLSSAPSAACALPPEPPDPGPRMPDRVQAMFDTMFSIFACDRAQVGSMMMAYSGYHWRYEWVPQVNVVSSIHDEVHHRDDERRDSYRRASRWDWASLGRFVERLKATPEGTGTLLDHSLVVGISHFGYHHDMRRVPIVLFGGAGGRLRTGRFLKYAPSKDNALFLTSVGQLMGLDLRGFGDKPDCGPLPGLV